MKIENKYYVVLDDAGTDSIGRLWERSPDFKYDDDYFDKLLVDIGPKDIMTLRKATKWKEELDREISSRNNDISFHIVPIAIDILFTEEQIKANILNNQKLNKS